MRGTDVTPAQMDAAAAFLDGRDKNAIKPKPGEAIHIMYDDLVRLVAWYGAIRYEGALNGVGEEGGIYVEKRP